jgi:hypothetical protein
VIFETKSCPAGQMAQSDVAHCTKRDVVAHSP